MINDKQIQKAIREAPASGKRAIELRDPGPRGTGRLTLVVRAFEGRVSADWYAVYYRNGKRAMSKLGSYPAMPIIEARAKFQSEYAPAIAAGALPAAVALRRQQMAGRRAGTVSDLFGAYVEHLRQAGRRSWRAAERILLSPTAGAARTLGADRLASSIEPSDIVAHLSVIYERGAPSYADSARRYLSAAFAFGMKSEHDYRRKLGGAGWGLKSNPVAAIPADASASKPGERFLTAAEVQVFWAWLFDYQRDSLAASAVLLKLALGQRTEEILRIKESGYERQKAMLFWTDTKNGLPHGIPLPRQAVEILDAMVPNEHGLFFPNGRDKTKPGTYHGFGKVITKYLKAHPEVALFTARDLRRTWKTLAGAAGIDKEMRDRLQNHTRGGDVSSRHYDRYDYLPERRGAMAKWEAYLDLIIEGKVDQLGSRANNVVPIGKGAVA